MRRFLLNLGLFALLQGLILVVVLVVSSRGTDENYMTATVDKHEAIARAEGTPKVLLVGGSNMAFGVSAEEMTAQLGVPVINVALHVGLGSTFQLNEAKAIADAGDTVVLSMEYSAFSTRRQPDLAVVLQLLQARPGSRSFVDPSIAKQLADEGLVIVGERAKLAQDHVLGGIQLSKPPYTRGSFNRFGDVVGHHVLDPERPLQVARGANTDEQVATATDEIRDAVAALTAQGVTVLYDYPEVPDERFELHADSIARVEAALSSVPGLIVIEEPASLPDRCFYDTEYHLIAECQQTRTARIIGALAGS